jgi:transposase-like protein
LKSTYRRERLNEELHRRTRVVRIFPNAARCLWLIRVLRDETHEGWLEDTRYLDMDLLWEARNEHRRKVA